MLRSACQTPGGDVHEAPPVLGEHELGDLTVGRGVLADVVADELHLAEQERVAVLVVAVQAPALDHAGADREDVGEHERVLVPFPARIEELRHRAAIVRVRDDVADGHPVREAAELLARGRDGLLVGEWRRCPYGRPVLEHPAYPSTAVLAGDERPQPLAVLPERGVLPVHAPELRFERRLALGQQLHELALDDRGAGGSTWASTSAGSVSIASAGRGVAARAARSRAAVRATASATSAGCGLRASCASARTACPSSRSAHASWKRARLRSTRKRRNRVPRRAPCSGFTIAPVACTLSAPGVAQHAAAGAPERAAQRGIHVDRGEEPLVEAADAERGAPVEHQAGRRGVVDGERAVGAGRARSSGWSPRRTR